ncbi:hypothetical protein FGIG_03588 [Fasciola gigantica]|uniref:Uncharacterized protein n=1 Tax=Fasciola gigantica TaxID=46835 RepID=A0A504YAE3_FASGI|nr:hypothetical protein FGIG_03588 [Fasciola gigantica]
MYGETRRLSCSRLGCIYTRSKHSQGGGGAMGRTGVRKKVEEGGAGGGGPLWMPYLGVPPLSHICKHIKAVCHQSKNMVANKYFLGQWNVPREAIMHADIQFWDDTLSPSVTKRGLHGKTLSSRQNTVHASDRRTTVF